MRRPINASLPSTGPSSVSRVAPSDIATLPLTDRTTAFLRKHGWSPKSSGPAGSLWWREGRSQSEVAVYRNMDEVTGSLQAIAMSLSTELGAPTQQIVSEISLWDTDVFKFRLLGDSQFDRSVPLTSLTSLMTSVQRMMRVSSTTALGYRPWVNGNYRKMGDEVYRAMRAGHSQEGSYIVPVFNPVGGPDEVAVTQPPLEGTSDNVNGVDSLERRVSRGLSRSLTAVEELIVRPGRLPRGDEMHQLQKEGVTRELLSNLSEAVTAQSVRSLEVGYIWAQSQALVDLPTEPTWIPTESASALDEVAGRLKVKADDPKTFYTGQVTGIQRADNEGHLIVTIDTTSRGHKTKLSIYLPGTIEAEATDWFRNRTVMTFYGKAVRRQGSLYIDRPDEYSAGLDVKGE